MCCCRSFTKTPHRSVPHTPSLLLLGHLTHWKVNTFAYLSTETVVVYKDYTSRPYTKHTQNKWTLTALWTYENHLWKFPCKYELADQYLSCVQRGSVPPLPPGRAPLPLGPPRWRASLWARLLQADRLITVWDGNKRNAFINMCVCVCFYCVLCVGNTQVSLNIPYTVFIELKFHSIV